MYSPPAHPEGRRGESRALGPRRGALRGGPRREGEEVRLPSRSCPEGKTAACAGPAGGHGGGAQRAGPEGEARGHGCPGLSAVQQKGVWDVSVASEPRRVG